MACDLLHKEGTEELKDMDNLLILVEGMRSSTQKARPPRTAPFQAFSNNNSSEDPVSMVVFGTHGNIPQNEHIKTNRLITYMKSVL